MSRQTFAVIIALLLIQQAYSQVHTGIKGGLNCVNNKIVQNDLGFLDDGMYRLGYHIGVFSTISLSDKLMANPELLFSSKGYKFPEANSLSGGSIHLNYINAPVLIGYQLCKKISLLAGPELGFLVSAKSRIDGETIDVRNIWNEKLDFGLVLGVRYSLIEKLNVGIRYIHGLASVIQVEDLRYPDGSVAANDTEFQNRTFQFSVEYAFK